MRGFIACVILLALWSPSTASQNVMVDQKTLIPTTALTSGSPTATSDPWNVAKTQNQSLQVTVTANSTPSVAVLVTGSVDTVTFATPTTGATVTTLTGTGSFLIPLSMPVSTQFRVQAVLGNSTTTTITVVGGAQ